MARGTNRCNVGGQSADPVRVCEGRLHPEGPRAGLRKSSDTSVALRRLATSDGCYVGVGGIVRIRELAVA